ncbi:transketolase [Patescibacteria group bacterium AH-259-L05]|nr:transketolase [Patescibacteria group bacterium AH-259-L05]
MRNAFIKTLTEVAEKNKNIFFITGDLGYSVIEDFQAQFPNQFLNAGVAEQNMTGIAAGLASTGKTVFTYSIGNFPTLRCLEQIRSDVCYHNHNVKIVAVGGGFHYGALASTHHPTEDLAILRSLPNMTVIAPNDPIEASLATKAVIKKRGPCYLRLSMSKRIHQTPPDFKIGKAITVREGNDISMITTGGMLEPAIEAAEFLSKENINVEVISMHTIKPIDKETILKTAQKTNAVVTIEEHTILGGLGGAVAEILMENMSKRIIFQRIGVNDTFAKKIGSRDFLRKEYGLTPETIVERVKSLLSNK